MSFRLAVIAVERLQDTEDLFSPHVAMALREYADAVERGDAGRLAAEQFDTSNGCSVRVIAGCFT
ncbi:MAG: hypothetical protein ACYC2K_15770 [Gemmatimonadales bacterium]